MLVITVLILFLYFFFFFLFLHFIYWRIETRKLHTGSGWQPNLLVEMENGEVGRMWILSLMVCTSIRLLFAEIRACLFVLFVYFFFILGPYSEENLSIPLFFHIAQYVGIADRKSALWSRGGWFELIYLKTYILYALKRLKKSGIPAPFIGRGGGAGIPQLSVMS